MILPKYPRTGMARGKVTFAYLAKLGVRIVRIGDHVVIAVADTIADFGSYGRPGAGFCDAVRCVPTFLLYIGQGQGVRERRGNGLGGGTRRAGTFGLLCWGLVVFLMPG